MGVSTVTAARILKGQLHHNTGEETRLEMDKFPHVALSKVSPAPLSAGSSQETGWGAKYLPSWGLRGPSVKWEQQQLLPETLF